MTQRPEQPETCAQCGHPFDPHALVTTADDPADGGIMLCPVPGCECFSTWGMEGMPTVRVPDRFEIASIREKIQAQEQD
ncbi:hypothetical protein [Catellatospora vulcania]|uniref:hypothetical protein n=1 Tax=Catellatospora vulcania TaxID=1460450 RepID=UPI0012D3925D|nr:hypothetical protein [Catellatospora vulcania]